MAKKVIYEIEVITASLDASERSIQSLIDRNRDLRNALREVPEQGTAAFQELDARVRRASNGTETLADRVQKLKNEYAENRNTVRDFNRELREGEKAANSINTLRQQVIQLNRELDNAEIGSQRFKDLTRQSATATKQLKDLEQQTLRFQRNVGNYQSIGQGIINTFSQVGKAIFAAFSIQGVINLTQQAVRDLVQTARDYSQAVATVGAISGATEEQMTQLNAEARRLGESTAFSATSAAEGMIELARAGFSVEEQLASTEPILNLAVAANAELGRTSEVAATAIRTYGFAATEAGRVTDVIAATFTSSQTSLESFSESFKQLGPAARSLGVPFEESAAVIGLLGDQGLRGTDATTALRTSLARLASQPKAVREELDRLNLSAFNQQGEFIGIANLVGELETRYENFTDEQRQASISLLFGNRALSQANILLNSNKEVLIDGEKQYLTGADAIRGYTEQLENAGEQAGEFTANLAEQQLDSFQGDITLLQSATEGLQLALFDLVEGNLRSVVQGVRAVVSELTLFTKGQGELAEFLDRNSTLLQIIGIAFGTYTAAVLANTIQTRINTIAQNINRASLVEGSAASRLAAIAKTAYSAALQVATGRITVLTAVTKTWRSVQLAINAALTANPIGLVIVAIGALIAGIVALYQNSQTVRAAVEGIGEAFSAIWARIQPIVEALGVLISEIFQVGFQVAQRYFNFVVGIWTRIFEVVRDFVVGYVNILRTIFDVATNIFSNVFNAAQRFLRPILQIFDPFIDRVREVFGGVFDVISGAFDRIRQAAIDAVGGIFDLLGIDVSGVTDAFNNVVSEVEGAADGAGADVADAFQQGFDNRIRREFSEEMKKAVEDAINQGEDYDLEPAKRKVAEALSQGVIEQEDADRILSALQEAVNGSDQQVTTDVTVDPTAPAFVPNATPDSPTGGVGQSERDAFADRLAEYQKQAAELEAVQLSLSQRGLDILRAQRLQELAEDAAFQQLRADQQIAILQDIEAEYTEARLALESDRQEALGDERTREIELLQERAVLLRQITTNLGVEEVQTIRQTTQETVEATVQRYEAQTQVIEEQAQARRVALAQQLEQQTITEEAYNEQLVVINQSAAARLQLAIEQRDAAIIATTEDANTQLLALAQERQNALNEVRVGAVTDITENFVNQLQELDRLRAEDLIDAQEYARQREEIEGQLTQVLIDATNATVEGIQTALDGTYDTQVAEALAFRQERLDALRGAYSEDAALAAAAFEEQRQILEARRADGTLNEDAFRSELEAIQQTYFDRVAAAQDTYQSESVQAQDQFNQEVVGLARGRVDAVAEVEATQTADLTTRYEQQVAELNALFSEATIDQATFAERSAQLESQYQSELADIQASAQAAQVRIDQEGFAARANAAQSFRDENEGTFDAVYQAQVEAISEAANAQQGILESTNNTLLELGREYNEQSIAENERFTATYVALVADRSQEITGVLDGTIVNLSGKFEQDLIRLQALRDADVIDATTYAQRVADLQANLQNELAVIQESSQADTSQFLELTFQQQLDASDAYHQRRLAQIDQQRAEELQAADNSANEQTALVEAQLEGRRITQEDADAAIEAISQARVARLSQIEAGFRGQQTEEEKRFADEKKAIIEGYLADVELAYQTEQVDLTSRFNDQLAQLTFLRNNDLISAEEYATRREAIETQLEDSLLESQLQNIQARLSIAEAGSQEYLRLKAQELALTRQQLDGEVEATEQAEKQKQDAIQATRDQQAEALDFLRTALSGVSSIIQQTAQNRIAVLERERDSVLDGIDARRADIEAQFEAAEAAANNAQISEETRQQRIEAAEAEKEAALERLDEEQEAEEEKTDAEIADEERKVARIQDIENRFQAFRDLLTAAQLANDSIRALSATTTAATEISAASAVAAAQGGAAVAKTASSVPFPANVIAIAGIVAAIATGISAVRRLVGRNETIARGEDGGFIQVLADDVQYMAAGGQSGARQVIRRDRTFRRRRSVYRGRKVRQVPRGQRIAIGGPHKSNGRLGGGLLTELERGEWVVPVKGVDMFKPQLAWMTQQANAKRTGKAYSTEFPEELFPTKSSAEIRRYAPQASRPPVINQPTRVSMGYANEGGEAIEGLGLAGAFDMAETNNLLREVSTKLDTVAAASREASDVNLSLIELRDKLVQLDNIETRGN